MVDLFDVRSSNLAVAVHAIAIFNNLEQRIHNGYGCTLGIYDH